MTKGKNAAMMELVVKSLRLNALVLLFDVVALTVYSLVRGVAFLDLIFGDALGFLLLTEAGILLLLGGGYVVASGLSLGKLRERLFRSEGWSPEDYRRSEISALPTVFAGVLLLAESLLSSLV